MSVSLGCYDSTIRALLDSGILKADHPTGKIFKRRQRPLVYDTWRELVQTPDHKGYIRLKISHRGKIYKLLAHRIVLISAHGAVPEGMEPDHINRDKTDNRLENLRFVTRQGNADNRNRLDWTGIRNGRSKLNPDTVRELRALRTVGVSVREICSRFGISKGTYSAVVSGITWREVS